MKRFILYSDMHLDGYLAMGRPLPDLPLRGMRDMVTVIAGDVYPAHDRKNFVRMLEYVAGNAEVVMFVPGNHEYYNPEGERGVPIKMLDESMISMCREVAPSRIHFMNTGQVDVGTTRFIGATLWTNTPSSLFSHAVDAMRDYTRIWSTPKTLVTPQEIVDLHHLHADYLYRMAVLAESQKMEDVVLVTHHVPDADLSSISWRHQNPKIRRFYYCTDTKPIWQQTSVITAWCCGHDHVSRFERLCDDSPVFISNALGYANQLNPAFDPIKAFSG